MSHIGFTAWNRAIGTTAAWGVFLLGLAYAVTTSIGFLSLKSPQDPIGDPFFSIMEILTVIIAAMMVIAMVSVHAYAPSGSKGSGLTALVFMILVSGITSCVHFAVLTVGRQIETVGPHWVSSIFSFKWPSLVYALDILAWDWFFSLSMLFAAPVFKEGRLERSVRKLLIISGVLSLAGLMGIPLANMQIRNIGIIGYAVVAPVAFLLIGIIFRRSPQTPIKHGNERITGGAET